MISKDVLERFGLSREDVELAMQFGHGLNVILE